MFDANLTYTVVQLIIIILQIIKFINFLIDYVIRICILCKKGKKSVIKIWNFFFSQLPALQSRNAFVKCQYDLCATRIAGRNATSDVENHKESSIATQHSLASDSHAIKSSSFLRLSNLYSSSQNKLERSLKTGNSFNSDISYSANERMKGPNKTAKTFPLTPAGKCTEMRNITCPSFLW